MLEVVFPRDTNYLGTAFGGYILSLMDKAASIAAVRHCHGAVVTARMDAIALHAYLVSVGRTSMTIQVDVYREHLASGEQQLATGGRFIFVAVDDQGRPTPVPRLPERAHQ